MYGFKHRATTPIPSWAINLKQSYFIIRVNNRNKTTVRKHYRMIEKEKLKLVESGIDYAQINAVCKYLVSLKQENADRLCTALITENKQLTLNFDYL